MSAKTLPEVDHTHSLANKALLSRDSQLARITLKKKEAQPWTQAIY